MMNQIAVLCQSNLKKFLINKDHTTFRVQFKVKKRSKSCKNHLKKGVKKAGKMESFQPPILHKKLPKNTLQYACFFSSNEGKNSSRMTPKKNPFFSSKRRKQSALMSEKIGKHQICRSKAFPRKYSIDEVLKKISDRKISQKNIR